MACHPGSCTYWDAKKKHNCVPKVEKKGGQEPKRALTMAKSKKCGGNPSRILSTDEIERRLKGTALYNEWTGGKVSPQEKGTKPTSVFAREPKHKAKPNPVRPKGYKKGTNRPKAGQNTARKASGPSEGFVKMIVSEEPCHKGSKMSVKGEKSCSQGVSSQQELVPQLLMGGNSHSHRGGWQLPYGFIGLKGGADKVPESRAQRMVRLAKERKEAEEKKKEERQARDTGTWVGETQERLQRQDYVNPGRSTLEEAMPADEGSVVSIPLGATAAGPSSVWGSAVSSYVTCISTPTRLIAQRQEYMSPVVGMLQIPRTERLLMSRGDAPLDLTTPTKRQLFTEDTVTAPTVPASKAGSSCESAEGSPPQPDIEMQSGSPPQPTTPDTDVEIQIGSVSNTFWIVTKGDMSYLDNLKQIFVQRSGQYTLLYMQQRDCPFGIIRQHATHQMDGMEEADLIFCNDPVEDKASTANCYNGSTFHLRNGTDGDFFSHQGSLWQCQDCPYGTTQYSTYRTEHLNRQKMQHKLFIKQQHQLLSWGKYQASRKKDGSPWSAPPPPGTGRGRGRGLRGRAMPPPPIRVVPRSAGSFIPSGVGRGLAISHSVLPLGDWVPVVPQGSFLPSGVAVPVVHPAGPSRDISPPAERPKRACRREPVIYDLGEVNPEDRDISSEESDTEGYHPEQRQETE